MDLSTPETEWNQYDVEFLIQDERHLGVVHHGEVLKYHYLDDPYDQNLVDQAKLTLLYWMKLEFDLPAGSA